MTNEDLERAAQLAAEETRAEKARADTAETRARELDEDLATMRGAYDAMLAHDTHWLRVRIALRLSVLEAERDATREAIDNAVIDHDSSCDAYGDLPRPCTCGMEVLLPGTAALRSKLTGPRIAKPEEIPEIAANLLPSNRGALAKVIEMDAEVVEVRARVLTRMAHEQAAKARREIRDAFHQKWGRFMKCSCGRPLGEPWSFTICREHPRMEERSIAGYAPPPEAP